MPAQMLRQIKYVREWKQHHAGAQRRGSHRVFLSAQFAHGSQNSLSKNLNLIFFRFIPPSLKLRRAELVKFGNGVVLAKFLWHDGTVGVP